MNIRIEISSLANPHQSGVASYTRLLISALTRHSNIDVYGHYFNFLRRQPQPLINGRCVHIEENTLVPLRVYAKLQSYGLALPFDSLLTRVDLTIFPNFATWPTTQSAMSATVIHDLTYLYYPEFVESKNLAHLRRVVPRSIHTADIILTVSESVKKELVKEFDLDPEKCIVTHVPPDDNFRKKCTKDEISAVRTKYKIGDKKFIFFLGNFEPRKNLKALINAYAKLPGGLKGNYRLILAGGMGWNTEDTQKALDDAKAAGNDIVHIGYIDTTDRAALYQSASLFVMPSLYEGFGIPVLEAMISGCPVVAADIPVLRETGGDAVLYADPKSAGSFANTIRRALDKYPYSTQAMIDSVNRFSWDKNITAILDATKKLK